MLVDTFDLLASKRESIAAYREYLDSVKRYWEVRVQLEQAVGGRLPETQGVAMPDDTDTPIDSMNNDTAGESMPGMHHHGGH